MFKTCGMSNMISYPKYLIKDIYALNIVSYDFKQLSISFEAYRNSFLLIIKMLVIYTEIQFPR